MAKGTDQKNSSAVFKVGAIALTFMILGFQVALFVHRAAVLRIEANRDAPDTVYVYVERPVEMPAAAGKAVAVEHRDAVHSEIVKEVRRERRKVESFRFNPNTAGLADLQRLGFSEKQAQAIVNYRLKGGRFRRKSDFAKSFVVADSVFARLEPYIDIPLLDINSADSAAFDALPGIGPYFASQMVSYREKVGGYTSVDQLMDIPRFDEERLEGIRDLIEVR
ncbi:MAG: helix-hairpin-helix domain-containing protein [Bacteroidia bacterium]|nr:helix-hairpin-helix domain-containing protein [Bacteroidia bacterium]